MGEFYNDDYEKVEAFSEEEVKAKVSAAVKEAGGGSAKELEDAKNELKEKTGEYDKLSKKYDSRKTEYDNLKEKFEETGDKVTKNEEDKKAAYEKMRDDMIKKAAGNDKQYAEELAKSYERIGEETLDSEVMEAQMKDAHALAMNTMSGDFRPFSMGDGATGDAPTAPKDGEKAFGETDSGKATMDHILTSMGQEPAKAEDNSDKK